MYQRGYVESIAHNDRIANTQSMYGCIEDMNPVSRVDCQEASPTGIPTETGPVDLRVGAKTIDGTFEMEFNACDGYKYNANVNATDITGPEDVAALVADETLQAKSNDLSAFVYRLFLEDRMKEDTMFAIYDTLTIPMTMPTNRREDTLEV